jgi:hypothetical protein
VPAPITDTPAPPAKLAAKTACIAAALTRPSLAPLPDGPPALATAYALVLPGSGWAVYLQHGRSRVLPLFTGPDEARDFLAGGRVPECRAVKLATARAVAEFLRSPPGRLGAAGGFLVALDPLDVTDLTPVLFTAREVLAALEGSGS